MPGDLLRAGDETLPVDYVTIVCVFLIRNVLNKYSRALRRVRCHANSLARVSSLNSHTKTVGRSHIIPVWQAGRRRLR